MKSYNTSSILIEDNLQAFFYERLSIINNGLSQPLATETIYYSSHVLNNYSSSENFFEKNDDGKIQEKILGTKLLEIHDQPIQEQGRILKDIGDTSLCLLGVFNESINKKIINERYYLNIGQNAYSRLNHIWPEYMDIENFYKDMSLKLEQVIWLMACFSKDFFKKDYQEELNIYKLSS